MRLSTFLLLACVLQAANPDLLTKPWPARWIWTADSDPFGYGVYHFRRTFELPAKPSAFPVHVTADNRYQLYVNGQRVAWGPARGDLFHWRYESVDIAPQLRAGRNVLAAVVWNDGVHRAVAQISHRTGFLMQGDTDRQKPADTGAGWKSFTNPAYKPIPITFEQVNGYVAIPPGEEVDGGRYPWGWEQPDYDDSSWRPATTGPNGGPRDSLDSPSPWFLVPRPIPMMEEKPERLSRVRLAEGVAAPAGFPKEQKELEIPARTRARLLLDQDYLTTAYPELVVSGGRAAVITLRYAEALWDKGGRTKSHRDQILGKELKGYRDVFIAGGGARRMWRPLFWRTWRYLELTIETKDEPLTVSDLRGVYTGYPFTRKARLETDSDEMRKILDIGWRTARLCAHETYMDCPYYEQLQYIGDARIQALVSLYMTGDARLMRNAIELMNASRTSEGATYSRAPSALQQYIPPFSLWWIGMVRDYWWYVDDPAFVRQMLPGVRAVLAYFEAHQKRGGSLGRMPWWNFVDWVDKWPRGLAPSGDDGSSAPLDLQLLLAYQWAAELEEAVGIGQLAPFYKGKADQIQTAIRQLYWRPERNLFADAPRRNEYSQHANSLAVLAGMLPGDEARKLMERVTSDRALTPATIYFRYYLNRAAAEAGLGDRYLDMLGPWRRMLADGLTTWAETDGNKVRSDCHAWGASPNIELFRTVLGIDSAAAGFRSVVIRPSLGKFSKISGAVPHPKGEIRVALALENGRLQAEVDLPPAVEGRFEWKGERRPLASGKSSLRF
ncbi:MAG: hypothetical protein KIT09_10020 [Bryobacteraceae bacterium]|nr:hypothetical protein [Bryobacteraceae bacterium]